MQLADFEHELRLQRVESLEGFGFAGVPAGYNELRGDEFVISTASGLQFGYRRGEGVRLAQAESVTCDPEEVDLWLHGAVWNAIAAIHGLIPLHASATATDCGITAIAGPSGSGKSTTAMALCSKDVHWFADDTLLIDPVTRSCLPGRRQWKLDARSLSQLDLEAAGPALAIDGKFRGIPPQTAPVEEFPLRRLVLLEKAGAGSVASISAGEAAAGLLSDSDRWHLYAHALQTDAEGLLSFFVSLCGKIDCFRVERGRDEVAGAVASMIGSLLEVPKRA